MSGAGFTKGPWKAVIHETLAGAKEDSGFDWLHSEKQATPYLPLGCVWVDTGTGLTGLPGHVETTAANARLIAAAPELYEAGEALIDDIRLRYPNEPLRCEYLIALERAVIKARGDQ